MPVLNPSTLDHRVSWRVADAVKNPCNDYLELLTPVSEFEGRGKHQVGIV
jgi:hypothetical protein